MDISPVAFKDPQILNNINDIFAEVDKVQAHIQTVAATLTEEDLSRPESMQWFSDRITWVRRYYERMEALVLHG